MPFSVLRRNRKRQRTDQTEATASPSFEIFANSRDTSVEVMTINSGSLIVSESDSEHTEHAYEAEYEPEAAAAAAPEPEPEPEPEPPRRRFFSVTSPFAMARPASMRSTTPFLFTRRNPSPRRRSPEQRPAPDYGRDLARQMSDAGSVVERLTLDDRHDDRDALTRLTDLTRDYARLEVFYEEVHRRYADAKGEIVRLREQVGELEGTVGELETTLAARERSIRSLRQAIKARR